jgi:ribosomal protein L24E
VLENAKVLYTCKKKNIKMYLCVREEPRGGDFEEDEPQLRGMV